MSVAPLRCVVDASVGIKHLVVEPLSEHADALFAQLAAEPMADLYAPDLFFSECANVLWKYVRRFGYPATSARQALVDLTALALRSVSTAELVEAALDIAVTHEVTAYDACYVALAHRLGVPLVTADEALVRKLAGTSYTVRRLEDFPLLPSR